MVKLFFRCAASNNRTIQMITYLHFVIDRHQHIGGRLHPPFEMFIMLATIYTYVKYKLADVEHEKGL